MDPDPGDVRQRGSRRKKGRYVPRGAGDQHTERKEPKFEQRGRGRGRFHRPQQARERPPPEFQQKSQYVQGFEYKKPQPVKDASKQPYWGRFPDYGDASGHCVSIVERWKQGTLECMICLGKIGFMGKLWNCDNCKTIFHFSCINKWIEKGLGTFWRCPGCNHEYSEKPVRRCFCGKWENPEPDPRVAPFTCGEPCQRKRDDDCPHLCPLLCHPGACPPCTSQAGNVSCFCGKTTHRPLCRDKANGIQCGSPCLKPLSCGSHFCNQNCHPGACPPCEQSNYIGCACGKTIESKPCGVTVFYCRSQCNKLLDCGQHQCEKGCHSGDCGKCEFSPELVKKCYCGQMDLSMILVTPRTSCIDPIPSCGMPCRKKLRCGHLCTLPCHGGLCMTCNEPVEKFCECGNIQQEMTCNESFNELRCNKVCNKRKSCLKHKCQTVCCPGRTQDGYYAHRCGEVCGKVLNCNLHTCLEGCHLGNCKYCDVIYRQRLYCACGRSYNDPPIICGGKDMEVFCTSRCNKELPCGHSCVSQCHSDECPACTQVVHKTCNCGALERPVPCRVQDVSCGKTCKKIKLCGHVCGRKCHADDCDAVVCRQVCGKPKQTCEHNCVETCHFGQECSQEPCEVAVRVPCGCGMQHHVCKCSQRVPKECDLECERLQRNLKLAKALGTPDKEEEYELSLVDSFKEDPEFVRKLEGKLDEFLVASEKMVFLPPMKAKQRQICHELIQNHYNLETLSHDKEPYRSVVIYRTSDLRRPSPLLSEFVAKVDQGQAKPMEEKEVMASLLFYQMSFSDSTADVEAALQRFQGDFYVKWKDDHSAYAHFFSLHKCMEAQKYLKGLPGHFQVSKLINYNELPKAPGFKKRFKNSKKNQEFVHTPPNEEVKTEEPVVVPELQLDIQEIHRVWAQFDPEERHVLPVDQIGNVVRAIKGWEELDERQIEALEIPENEGLVEYEHFVIWAMERK